MAVVHSKKVGRLGSVAGGDQRLGDLLHARSRALERRRRPPRAVDDEALFEPLTGAARCSARTRWPAARSAVSVIAVTDPLPLVPATMTDGEGGLGMAERRAAASPCWRGRTSCRSARG